MFAVRIANSLQYRVERIKTSLIARRKDKVLRTAIGGGNNYTRREIALKDLVAMQCRKSELMRYDIAVRLLAIEEYYGKNDYGWSLYAKMQAARHGGIEADKHIFSDEAKKNFKKLIESFHSNGYQTDSPILVDRNLLLCDGSHRIACGLYFGVQSVSVGIIDFDYPVDYSAEWFFCNGFSLDEISLIRNKANEISQKCLKSIISCVLWAPALPYLDEIIEELSFYGKVEGLKRYRYPKALLPYVMELIYAVDDVESWQIEKKLAFFDRYKEAELIHFNLRVADMQFRIKGVSNLPISVIGERVKRVVRQRCSERIAGYFHDIVMHTGDNTLQGDFINHIFEPGIDMEEIIAALEPYEYALLKVDTPYMPPAFPKSIPIGKDLDVLLKEKDLIPASEAIIRIVQKYSFYEVRLIREENGIRIRMEKFGNLFYQIDLSKELKALKKAFVKDALSQRVRRNGYYVLAPEYEYIVRMASYYVSGNKRHHLDYLQTNTRDYNSCLADRFCLFENRVE